MPAKRFQRSVSTFHDLFVMSGEYSTADFRNRFTALAQEAAKRSDLIIAVSQFTADQVHDLLGVERSRLRVIHHGVRRVQDPEQYAREKIILHVGAIQTRKNISRLVRAFEAMPSDWTLVLAGSTGFGGEQILEQIRRSGACGRIRVTGYVSATELDRLYRRAAICAFPSLDEGFGLPVLEAMANGLPVVASDRSALPEVCGDAALLVNPLEADDIAGALRLLADTPLLRSEYAAKGYARSQMFSWESAVEKTWNVYRELLD
jgi:glycosyltransferase involved in cell wall biosynthesis